MGNDTRSSYAAKLEMEINEIESYFSKPFDRQEAIRIIKKHHFTDMNIAIADVFLNFNDSTLSFESPNRINTYIGVMEIYLTVKLKNLRNAGSNH